LTKRVLETGLEVEMWEHVGYDKHGPGGRERGSNARNGTPSETVRTDVGPVPMEVPRDRDGTFEPQVVKKRQRRLSGVDEMVISLTAEGLTTGEVSGHMGEVYGADVSEGTISPITDRIVAEMSGWQNRPLDRVYPVVFIDAMVVKIRDGQVTNRPVYTAIGVTVDGEGDLLGLWVGSGGEGAKFWLQVLTENRGVEDVCIVVCDGLRGLPEAINNTWPLAIVQTCVLHLIRNTFRFASKADWDKIARDLRPVYTAVSEHDAKKRFCEFTEWGDKHPAIIRRWELSRAFNRKVDAGRWVRDELQKQDRGLWVDPSAGAVRFEEYAEEWFRGLVLKPKTIAGYRSLLDSRILPTLGAVELRRISPDFLRVWVAAMAADGLSASRMSHASCLCDLGSSCRRRPHRAQCRRDGEGSKET